MSRTPVDPGRGSTPEPADRQEPAEVPRGWARAAPWLLAGAGSLLALLVLRGMVADGGAAAARPSPLEPSPPLPDLKSPGVVLLYLAAAEDSLPRGVAPVLAIRRGGAVRLARPPAPELGPTPAPWLAAGIVIPGGSLAALSARERASLLCGCALLAGPGALAPDQVVGLGVSAPPAMLARWLAWMR